LCSYGIRIQKAQAPQVAWRVMMWLSRRMLQLQGYLVFIN
jgi:hypothetical protein